MSVTIKEFPAVPGDDFGAQRAADSWLDERGFSFGPSQVGGPQAIWYGDCTISKWRNLSAEERRDAHAIMDGTRGGTVRITLRAHAPAAAFAAFNLADGVSMSATTLIQAAPVVRDETGCWWHPDMPEFEEGRSDEWRAWQAEQQLEIRHACLDGEDMDHPVYIAVFDEGGCDFSAWEPTAPAGEGWFTLCIGDTEDGPQWCWARRIAPEAA